VTAQPSGSYGKTKCIDDDDDDGDGDVLDKEEKATDCIIARQTYHIYRSKEKGKLEGTAGGEIIKQELVGGLEDGLESFTALRCNVSSTHNLNSPIVHSTPVDTVLLLLHTLDNIPFLPGHAPRCPPLIPFPSFPEPLYLHVRMNSGTTVTAAF
jgi:hypothetical protein